MVGVDSRIRTMPFGLGGKGIHQKPAQQAADAGQNKQHVAHQFGLGFFKNRMFTGRRRWMVPCQLMHEKMEPHIAQKMKNNGSEPGHQTDPEAVQGPFADHGKRCLGVFFRHSYILI